MTATEEPVRKFKRPLPVEMTEEEKIKRGQKAGSLKKAIAKVKAEMKLATADHKERLKQHQSNLDAILDDLETGTEIRQVECFEKKDFTKKKVEVIRMDTEEAVETRTMSPFELQTKVPGTSGNGSNGADEDGDDDEEDLPEVSAAPKKRGRPRGAKNKQKEATA